MTKPPLTRNRAKLLDSNIGTQQYLDESSRNIFYSREDNHDSQRPITSFINMQEYEKQAETKTRNMVPGSGTTSYNYDISGPVYSSSTQSNTFSQSASHTQETLTLEMQQLLNNMASPDFYSHGSSVQSEESFQPQAQQRPLEKDNSSIYGSNFNGNGSDNSLSTYQRGVSSEVLNYLGNASMDNISENNIDENSSNAVFETGRYNEDRYEEGEEGNYSGYRRNKKKQKIHQQILYQQVHNNQLNQLNQLNQHQHQHQHIQQHHQHQHIQQHHQHHQHQNIERIEKVEHIHNHQNFGSLFKSVVLQLPEHLLKLTPSLLKNGPSTALPTSRATKTKALKKKTRSRGTYKRSTLAKLLENDSAYKFINKSDQFEVGAVNYIGDYRQYNQNCGISKPHEILKTMGFRIGTYSQSDYLIRGKPYFLKQARCKGGSICSHCNISYNTNLRICQVIDCKRRLRTMPCSITVYYLYPAIPINVETDNKLVKNIDNLLNNMTSLPDENVDNLEVQSSEPTFIEEINMQQGLSAYTRILVFIPDDGEVGHSHPVGLKNKNNSNCCDRKEKLHEDRVENGWSKEEIKKIKELEKFRHMPVDSNFLTSLNNN